MDDAIEGLKGPYGRHMSYRKMHSLLALRRGEAEQLSVSMRISLDGLDALWQQRIRERYQAHSLAYYGIAWMQFESALAVMPASLA